MKSIEIIMIILTILLLLSFIVVYFCFPSHIIDYFKNVRNKDILYSDHQKFKVGSFQLKLCKENNLKTLEIFNKFADNNNILYTAIAGSLIGSYIYKDMIPWDDDIDILLRECDWNKFYKLWSENKEKPKINFPDMRFRYKNININGYKLILLKNITNKGFLKLKLPHNDYEEFDIGGIDIGYMYYNKKKKKYYESLNRNKIAPKLSENDNELVVPYKKFGSTKIRTIIPERGEKYLDDWYGKQWRIPKRPSKNILSKIRKKDLGI